VALPDTPTRNLSLHEGSWSIFDHLLSHRDTLDIHYIHPFIETDKVYCVLLYPVLYILLVIDGARVHTQPREYKIERWGRIETYLTVVNKKEVSNKFS